jgi:hypothetical protein
MTVPGESDLVLPARGALLGLMGGAFAVGSLFAVITILPTLGRTGGPEITLTQTPSPPPQVSRATETALREDSVILRLGGTGQPAGTDYLVRMTAGDAVALSWTATAPLTYELHGHDVAANAPGKQVTYLATGTGAGGNSYLIAPADGFYGFFFQPKAGAAQVTLKLSGFYKPEPGLFSVP